MKKDNLTGLPLDDVLRCNLETRTLTAGGRAYRLTEMRPKATKYSDRFAIIFQDFCDEIAEKPLKLVSFRLLFWTFGQLEHKRWRTIYQEEAAQLFGVSQPTISKALCELTQRGFLDREKRGRTFYYRLALKATWRGSAAGYHAEKKRQKAGKDDRPETQPPEKSDTAETRALIEEALEAADQKQLSKQLSLHGRK